MPPVLWVILLIYSDSEAPGLLGIPEAELGSAWGVRRRLGEGGEY